MHIDFNLRLDVTCVAVAMENFAAPSKTVMKMKSMINVDNSVCVSQSIRSVGSMVSPIHLPVLLYTAVDWHLLISIEDPVQVL